MEPWNVPLTFADWNMIPYRDNTPLFRQGLQQPQKGKESTRWSRSLAVAEPSLLDSPHPGDAKLRYLDQRGL